MKERIVSLSEKISALFLCGLVGAIPFSTALVEVCAVGTISMWMIAQFYKRPPGIFKKNILTKPLLFYLLVNFASLFFSAEVGQSVRAFFTKVIKYIILYYAVYDIAQNRIYMKRIVQIFCLMAALIAIDGAVQHQWNIDFIRHYGLYGVTQIRASFKNPNDFAAWVITLMPLIASLCIFNQEYTIMRFQKIVTLCILLVLSYCLAFTDARAAWLSLILGLCFYLFLFVRNLTRRKAIGIYICFFISLIVVYMLLPVDIQNRVLTTFSLHSHENYRVSLWKKAWLIIRDFNLLGCGLNSYCAVAGTYDEYFVRGHILKTMYAHNCYLQMLAEIGIFGLGTFLWILGVLLKKGMSLVWVSKPDPILVGLFVGLCIYLLHSFFDTNLYSVQLAAYFWMLLGLTAGYMHYVENENTCCHKEKLP